MDAIVAERDKLAKMMGKIGTINTHALQNAKICTNRNEVLNLLPKEKVCIEIGVAFGDYSKLILEKMNPSIFYAVDYFGGEEGKFEMWGRTDVTDSHLTHKAWYERKFDAEIKSGKMKVIQGFSWDVMETFPDRFFDYIYLDACHDYYSASKDVEVIKRKIKNGGIIAFNDYTLCDIYTTATQSVAYYGVVPVVNQLINSTKSEVLYLCFQQMMFNDLVVRYWE